MQSIIPVKHKTKWIFTDYFLLGVKYDCIMGLEIFRQSYAKNKKAGNKLYTMIIIVNKFTLHLGS